MVLNCCDQKQDKEDLLTHTLLSRNRAMYHEIYIYILKKSQNNNEDFLNWMVRIKFTVLQQDTPNKNEMLRVQANATNDSQQTDLRS